MLSVVHNAMMMNTQRQFGIANRQKTKAAEKLSSGYKINRAADDAAGLSISEKMRRQVRGLNQAADNITEGIGYVQTAEGALNEVSDILQRINQLSVKAANGTNTTEDRSYINMEVQQLKAEMNRIFAKTTFNEEQIWSDKPEMRKPVGTEEVCVGHETKEVGTTPVQAVTVRNTTNSFSVTNNNYDVLAYGGYSIHAAESGIHITWKGYDGNNYATEKIDWDKLKDQNYTFEMSDYFGDKNDASNKLYDAGKPVFTHKVSFTPVPEATVDDMIACLDGTSFSQSLSASMSGRFEVDGNQTSTFMNVTSVSVNYSATVASRSNANNITAGNPHNYNAADDKWIEPSRDNTANQPVSNTDGNLTSKPSAVDVASARNSSEGWTFSFYVDGIGMVQGKSTRVSYWASSETAKNDEGVWWEWRKRWNGKKYEPYKGAIERSTSGTLGGVMDALTGDKSSNTPGLLRSDIPNVQPDETGASDTGGTIEIDFSLTADTPYTYAGNVKNSNVGSFTLRFSVGTKTEDGKPVTEDYILGKINGALNDATTLDFYSSSAQSDHSTIYDSDAKPHTVDRTLYDDVPIYKDVPIYEGINHFWVQAGAEAGQHIDIQYATLRNSVLGIENTNTLTVEDSWNAINEIKAAMQIVNTQRSDFGAYQNRLEHAYQVNKNTEENTQASEAVVRDADVSEEVMKHSMSSILEQAAGSMMSHSKQDSQYALQLLQ